MIYYVEGFLRSKNTPTTYLPVSRVLDTLSTKLIMAWLVECFFSEIQIDLYRTLLLLFSTYSIAEQTIILSNIFEKKM